jgi:hypothetical protein
MTSVIAVRRPSPLPSNKGCGLATLLDNMDNSPDYYDVDNDVDGDVAR